MIDLETIFASLVLVGTRLSGLMLFAPFFGSASIPPRIKAGFVLLMTWVLAPLAITARSSATSPSQWSMVAMGELVIGLMLGLFVQFVFEAAQLAGQILGVQMGFSLVHVLDPQSQADTAVLSLFHQTIVLLIFLALDVPNWLLRGLAHSYMYLPAGTVMLRGTAVEALLQSAGSLFLSGIQIAAPVLCATMIADLALGFIGKASPQLPVLFVGLSIKSVLGMVVLIATIVTWPRWFDSAFTYAVSLGERALQVSR